MKPVYSKLATAALLCSLGTTLHAAEVKVTWQEPDEYRDIDPANQSRGAFRKQVFTNLEEYFNELAQDLPDDAVWDITVTNVDLAGQVWPASFVGFGSTGGEVRLIKSVDIPRIAFSYTLTSGSGEVMKSADVSIKDMGFMDGLTQRNHWDNLRYEKRMLKDWFNEELSQKQLSRQ
ncbi:DUF3016 domain-containing protein [Alteromonas halophila]|uniref:DUF3016 domain-containing protein n=1 Tax=Alteromonas halophila TaxID=516698 RepID=A0A918JH01_9ALTE|nr:DUF3016 domain-containing protein [Alteromonas halophila]GGW80340.1 hypothetical protein GCM10007391_11560 [Alteromonas halophila]